VKNLTFLIYINRKHFYSSFDLKMLLKFHVYCTWTCLSRLPYVVYIQKMKVSNNERERNQVWCKQTYPSNNIYLMQSTVCVVMKQQSVYLKMYIPIHHTWWWWWWWWWKTDITRIYSHFLSSVSFALRLGSPQNVHSHNKHWLIQQS
jgi:hypothetical protein